MIFFIFGGGLFAWGGSKTILSAFGSNGVAPPRARTRLDPPPRSEWSLLFYVVYYAVCAFWVGLVAGLIFLFTHMS